MYWLALADFREKGSDNEISFERGSRLVFGICYLNIWHQIAENLVFENRNSRFLN